MATRPVLGAAELERAGLAGAVLAGGASRRMGTDKAFIEVRGRPLVAAAAEALAAAGAEPVIVVGGDVDRLAALGLNRIDDPHPGHGPAQAIAGALAHLAPAEMVAILACDLLAPTSRAISALLAALTDASGAAIAVPVVDGQQQWLHAVWRREVGLGQLQAAWARGERSIRNSLDPQLVVEVEGIDAEMLADADTPADLP